MAIPETCYARSGDVSIAYQAFGEGPVDLVWISGIISNVEYQWVEPRLASFLERIASFSRLIRFDKRGTGLSDGVDGVPTLEQRMDDVRAVMDDAGCDRAVLLGAVEGAPIALLFAATYPERTLGLVLYGSHVKTVWAPDFPWAPKFEEHLKAIDEAARFWGTRRYCDETTARLAPNSDDEFRRFWGSYMRVGASPAAATALMRMNMQIDVREVLPAIRVPTLILHRREDPVANVEQSRYMAQRIPNARYVELEGCDQIPMIGDTEALFRELESFVSEVKDSVEPDRMLATVLFTDIVDSTVRAAELGDARWGDLLVAHHAIIRGLLARFRGKEIDTAGDGFFATFEGPARAVECACAAVEGIRELGLELRAGLHTGECEVADGKVSGIAVHIGARIAAEAGAGEVLVSSTVKDLVVGAGIHFRERGVTGLKGVPGEWRLFAVENA
ncbi:MAG: adenylate/guanylate cyclase domain-containing protein [Gaiellaceae bacterium]